MMRAHIQYLMCVMAKEYVSGHQFADKTLRPLLLLLIKIFALKQLANDAGLYACGYFHQDSQLLVDDSLHQLLTELRPHMIPLVETFANDVQDYNVIGNKYGDIYELQLEMAKRAKINRNVVPPFYEKHMKPTMTMHKAKL
jgi:Acyl-CoA oxidase